MRFGLLRDGSQSRLVITDIEEGSSASRATQPLHAGDLLTHIDNIPCMSSNFDSLGGPAAFVGRLLGPPGTEVRWQTTESLFAAHEENKADSAHTARALALPYQLGWEGLVYDMP